MKALVSVVRSSESEPSWSSARTRLIARPRPIDLQRRCTGGDRTLQEPPASFVGEQVQTDGLLVPLDRVDEVDPGPIDDLHGSDRIHRVGDRRGEFVERGFDRRPVQVVRTDEGGEAVHRSSVEQDGLLELTGLGLRHLGCLRLRPEQRRGRGETVDERGCSQQRHHHQDRYQGASHHGRILIRGFQSARTTIA